MHLIDLLTFKLLVEIGLVLIVLLLVAWVLLRKSKRVSDLYDVGSPPESVGDVQRDRDTMVSDYILPEDTARMIDNDPAWDDHKKATIMRDDRKWADHE